jgi:hypothetical protein
MIVMTESATMKFTISFVIEPLEVELSNQAMLELMRRVHDRINGYMLASMGLPDRLQKQREPYPPLGPTRMNGVQVLYFCLKLRWLV